MRAIVIGLGVAGSGLLLVLSIVAALVNPVRPGSVPSIGFESGGLGLTRREWESIHGGPTRQGAPGSVPYVVTGRQAIVQFSDVTIGSYRLVSDIELFVGGPTNDSDAVAIGLRLAPPDAVWIDRQLEPVYPIPSDTRTPTGPRVVEYFQSASLAERVLGLEWNRRLPSTREYPRGTFAIRRFEREPSQRIWLQLVIR